MVHENLVQMSEQLKKGICPVCERQCGLKLPRHAVINHLRRSGGVDHVVFRAKYYKTLLPWGHRRRHPAEESSKPNEILAEIEKTFGKEMVPRLVEAAIDQLVSMV
jgi:hypothetical protein